MPDSAAVALLVLLPGLDGSGKLFRGFINSIGAALEPRIVSYPPDQPLGYEELESLIEAALPSQRPFFLLGESFSGPLAARSARTGVHAAAVSALVFALRRRDVGLGGDADGEDSFPQTNGEHLPASLMFIAELTSRS